MYFNPLFPNLISKHLLFLDSHERFLEKPSCRLPHLCFDGFGVSIDSFSIDGQMDVEKTANYDKKTKKASFGSARICQISGESQKGIRVRNTLIRVYNAGEKLHFHHLIGHA